MKKDANVQTSNVTTNPTTSTVYIPMIVDMEAFHENGFIAGITASDIRHNWRIGNRYCDVVPVPGTEEEKAEYLRSVTNEFKKQDRDARCFVSDGKSHIIKCPEANLCSKCPYHVSLDKCSDRTQIFSELAMTNETGKVTDFEPTAPTGYDVAATYARILEQLIDHLHTLTNMKNIDRLIKVIRLRAEEHTIVETAKAIGCGKSTVDSDLDKLYPIVKDFLENFI